MYVYFFALQYSSKSDTAKRAAHCTLFIQKRRDGNAATHQPGQVNDDGNTCARKTSLENCPMKINVMVANATMTKCQCENTSTVESVSAATKLNGSVWIFS